MKTAAYLHVLDELKVSLGCKITIRQDSGQSLPRSRGKWGVRHNSFVLLFERGVSFTPLERRFARLVLTSFDSLNQRMGSRGVTHQYLQTSLMTSVLDIAISRFIASSRSQFLNIHTLIQHFKRLSFEQYEGEQVKTGIIVRKGKLDDYDDVESGKVTYETVPFEDKIRIKQSLINDTAFFRYVDGVDSFYCCDHNLNISGYVNVLADSFNSLQRLSGRRVETIIDSFKDVYFYIGVNSSSDVEIFVNNQFRIVFRKGRWHFIDCESLDLSLTDSFDYNEFVVEPWRIFYSLSKIRKGAAALLVDEKSKENYKDIVIGHVSKDQELFSAVSNGMLATDVARLCDTGELLRILTTDGMTIFSDAIDSVYDFSAIVDTSLATKSRGCKSEGGGGRTTAVCACSKYGKAIKVSEDGPISVYNDEELIYKNG